MQFEIGLPATIALFLLTSIVVIGGAVLLAISGDVIADKSRWGRLWVGTILIAGATSLPELVTTVTAVMIDAPKLAGGNIFGANMLNVSNLAIVIALVGGRKVYQRIMPQQGILLGLAIILTGSATLLTLLQLDTKWYFVSPASLMLFGIYIFGSRFLHKQAPHANINPIEPDSSNPHTLRWGLLMFSLAAMTVFVAAPFLASSANRIAELTGISQSFIGVLAVGIVTTLPELTATITAMRIRAYDLAISGMYGSNAFNVVALAVADFFSSPNSLFARLDGSHVLAGSLATLLMVLGYVQIKQRKDVKHFAFSQPSTSLIVGIYLIGLYSIFRMG